MNQKAEPPLWSTATPCGLTDQPDSEKTIECRGNALNAAESVVAKFLFKARRLFTATDRQANGFIRGAQKHGSCSLIGGWQAVPDYYEFISVLDGALGALPQAIPKVFPFFAISRCEMKVFRECRHYHYRQAGGSVESRAEWVNEVLIAEVF